MAQLVTTRINKNYGTDIRIDQLDLSSLRNVEFKSVLIYDHHNDTLIAARNVKTSILNYANLFKSDLDFGEIHLKEGTFNLITYKDDTVNNLSVFVRKFNKNKSEKANIFTLNSSSIWVDNIDFTLYNFNKKEEPIVFYHDITGYFDDFSIRGAQVSARIHDVSLIENHGLNVERFNTNFKYTNSKMEFFDTSLFTEGSELQADIVFNYQKKDLLDFTNKVQIDADIQESSIILSDLSKLYGEFGRYDQIHFSCKAKGTINDFVLRDIDLESERNSSLRGSLHLHNVLIPKEFVMTGDIRELSSNYDHLINLLPSLLESRIPKALDKIGFFSSSGKIKVSKSALDIQLKTISEMGLSNVDLQLMDIDKGDLASYRGKIELIDFKLGKFVKDPLIGEFSMKGEVDGQGFSIEGINIKVKGEIYKHQYKGYTYSNIDINGVLSDQQFNGYLNIDDPNIQLEFKGLVEIADTYKVNFNADVAYADFYKLNLFKRDEKSILKGVINMDFEGSHIDNIEGEISFKNASYSNQNDDYYFKDFTITSQNNEYGREFKVNSNDIINGYMKGNFKYGQLKKLAMNSLGSLFVNYQKEKVTKGQYLDFNFSIYNKIIDVFIPDLKLGPNSIIRGRVDADKEEFKLTVKSPNIDAYDINIDDISLQVDNTNPLYNTLLSIEEVKSKYYNLSDIYLVNVVLNDTLFMRADLKGGKERMETYSFSFYHTINEKNQSVLGMKRSEMFFKNKLWMINPENNDLNKVVYDKEINTYAIDKFIMSNGLQQIQLAGLINGTYDKNIDLRFDNVNLYDITPSIDSVKIEGKVNGRVNLRTIDKKTLPFADITVNYFSINGDYYGDLNFKGGADESIKNYAFGANLLNGGLQTIRAHGAIDFSEEEPSILATLSLQKFKINSFSPLGKNVLSNIRGFATGTATFSGSLANPYLDGEITLEESGLELPYLNVDYDFDGESIVKMTNHTFDFQSFKVIDRAKGTTGVIRGTIEHDQFKRWYLDLTLTTDNLLVLNRDDYDGALYYGTGYLEGSTFLKGYTDNLRIEVDGKTKPGTEFIVPLGNVSTVNSSQLIHFENLVTDENGEEKKEFIFKKLKGLNLSFNLEVTRDAIAQIVLDRTTGSVLRGSGDGDLTINIDPNGKFEMFGDLVIDHGEYQFKNIVNKDFQVMPGGTIIWDGSPYNAQVNITAINYTKANPSVLLDEIASSRKIEVELYTNITGNLTSPKLDFDVKIPNASSVVASELDFKLRNEDDKLTQFFSLLATGSFAATSNNRTNFDGNAAITGTLAQKASQLLSSMLESDNENFEVGVTYDIGTDNRVQDVTTDDQLGLEVSGRIADKVIVSGKVGVPVGSNTNSNVIGEVEVKIPLNDAETLQAKMYNRQNEIQFDVIEGEGYTQGVGISYRFDFNNAKEFLEKLGIKKTEEEKNMTKEELDSLKVVKKEVKKEVKEERKEERKEMIDKEEN